jgi:hypothetical protein
MDDGVDPREMCPSLVQRLGQSEQLKTFTDPELLILFEDWLEELEKEAVSVVKRTGSTNARNLAKELGLSDSGATFLLAKLKREGKI